MKRQNLKEVKPKDCVTLPEFLTKRIVEQASKKYEWEHKKVQEVYTLMKESCEQWYAFEFDKKQND